MLDTIFIIAIVLVAAVILAIARVVKLIGAVRGDNERTISANNKWQALSLMLFLVGGLAAFFYFSFYGVNGYSLPIASAHGVITDRLFWITMAITCTVFMVTQIFLFGFAYRYQHKESREATFYPHNNRLEQIWTIIPAIVLALLVFSGWKAWTDITDKSPEGTEVIEIMGYQYAWAFRYGGNKDGELGKYDFQKIDLTNSMGIDFEDQRNFDDFMSGQLVIPKGRPVEFRIRARDVIHSVYNPHFRIQMNAVPGYQTRFWFTPTKSTEDMRAETGKENFEYELVCNKICGKNHYGMKAIIKVLEPEEYDQWKLKQTAWLKQNQDYLENVPQALMEAAIVAADIERENVKQAPTEMSDRPTLEEDNAEAVTANL